MKPKVGLRSRELIERLETAKSLLSEQVLPNFPGYQIKDTLHFSQLLVMSPFVGGAWIDSVKHTKGPLTNSIKHTTDSRANCAMFDVHHPEKGRVAIVMVSEYPGKPQISVHPNELKLGGAIARAFKESGRFVFKPSVIANKYDVTNHVFGIKPKALKIVMPEQNPEIQPK